MVLAVVFVETGVVVVDATIADAPSVNVVVEVDALPLAVDLADDVEVVDDDAIDTLLLPQLLLVLVRFGCMQAGQSSGLWWL